MVTVLKCLKVLDLHESGHVRTMGGKDIVDAVFVGISDFFSIFWVAHCPVLGTVFLWHNAQQGPSIDSKPIAQHRD